MACSDCYLDAGPDRSARAPDLDTRLEQLAAMGVFEIALGGGEGLVADPDGLLATAERIRALGMVPNLTTSGFGVTEALADRLQVMGQVNVSIDGLGKIYADSRGFDGTRTALGGEEMSQRLRTKTKWLGADIDSVDEWTREIATRDYMSYLPYEVEVDASPVGRLTDWIRRGADPANAEETP